MTLGEINAKLIPAEVSWNDTLFNARNRGHILNETTTHKSNGGLKIYFFRKNDLS